VRVRRGDFTACTCRPADGKLAALRANTTVRTRRLFLQATRTLQANGSVLWGAGDCRPPLEYDAELRAAGAYVGRRVAQCRTKRGRKTPRPTLCSRSVWPAPRSEDWHRAREAWNLGIAPAQKTFTFRLGRYYLPTWSACRLAGRSGLASAPPLRGNQPHGLLRQPRARSCLMRTWPPAGTKTDDRSAEDALMPQPAYRRIRTRGYTILRQSSVSPNRTAATAYAYEQPSRPESHGSFGPIAARMGRSGRCGDRHPRPFRYGRGMSSLSRTTTFHRPGTARETMSDVTSCQANRHTGLARNCFGVADNCNTGERVLDVPRAGTAG
jgi:hypothetical protein